MTGISASGSVPEVPLSRYTQGEWTPAGAILCSALVLGLSQLFSLALVQSWLGWNGGVALLLDFHAASKLPLLSQQWLFVAVQIASQLLELVLLWLWLGWRGTSYRFALNLRPVRLGASAWARLIVLLFAVKLGATLLATATLSVNPSEELGAFVDMARLHGLWLALFVTVVLAALTEELIFRGILSRTLEATRLGFWGGATLANLAFASVHLQYGIGGQAVVLAIGMTLSWIRRETGSLWPCIVCHAANNAVALLAMKAIA